MEHPIERYGRVVGTLDVGSVEKGSSLYVARPLAEVTNDALLTEIEDLRRAKRETQANYEGACATVAAMHAAAVGRNDVGPLRGVVEDVEDVRVALVRIVESSAQLTLASGLMGGQFPALVAMIREARVLLARQRGDA